MIKNTRREMLAGLGALTGSTLIGSAAGTEAAVGPISDPAASAPGGFRQEEPAPAPLTPGMRYVNIVGMQFQPTNNAFVYASVNGELNAPNPSTFTYHLAGIPTGARLAELVGYFVKNAASDIFLRISRTDASPGGTALQTVVIVSTSAFGLSPTTQTITAPIASTPLAFIDPGTASHFALVNMPGSADVRLNAIRVGYFSPQASFVPLPPGRVFDSRLAVFGAARLLSGTNMLIDVSHLRDLAGTITMFDFVPPGAAAIAFNLTIAETAGQGWLGVTTGDSIIVGGSSINWSGAGQILSTGTNSTVNAARLIRVFCGGTPDAAAHFVIDVTGNYI